MLASHSPSTNNNNSNNNNNNNTITQNVVSSSPLSTLTSPSPSSFINSNNINTQSSSSSLLPPSTLISHIGATSTTSAPLSSLSSLPFLSPSSSPSTSSSNISNLLNHPINTIFNNGFKDYMDSKRFSDVKLIYGNNMYDTHRIILAYSSEFFKRLLSSEFREASQTVIELRQPDPYNVFPHVLSFMYDGRVWMSPDNVVPLLAMADHYLIHALQTLCNKYLETNLNRENVVSILRTSISFHFDHIIDKCIGIIAKNFPYICEQQQLFKCNNSNQQQQQNQQNQHQTSTNNTNTNTNTTTTTSSTDNLSSYNDFDLMFLPSSIFITLLKHPYLVVKNEYTLYQIVIHFIKYKQDQQQRHNQQQQQDNNNQDQDQDQNNNNNSCIINSDDINELMSHIRYIWMTYDQLIEISSNILVPRDILIETFMERLKKYESTSSSSTISTIPLISVTNTINNNNNNNTDNFDSANNTTNNINNNNNKNYVINTRFLPRPPQSIPFEYNYDFDNKGILYWIATNGYKEKWTNPHTSSRIKITSSSIDKGNLQDIVELAPFEFWTKDVPASWVTIDLGSNRSVIPMYYTIRHGLSFKSDSLRTWDFQGSTNGEQWTVLKRHTTDSSLNLKYATHTWSIPNITAAYRYFRILQTGKNSNNRNFLVIGGIELYGELLQS